MTANNWWCAALVTIVLTFGACGGSIRYSSDPIDAVVVDAESGQPIEGAIVTANWQLLSVSLDSERRAGQLKVMEAVTDAKGQFHFDDLPHSIRG